MTIPRVFDPGVLTFAVGIDGATVSIGSVDFAYIKSFRVEWTSETREHKVILEFFRSHDPEVSRAIEENIRLARTLRWVEVLF